MCNGKVHADKDTFKCIDYQKYYISSTFLDLDKF